MINANDAKEVFIKMLNESGFRFDKPSPKLAWNTFKQFSSIKIDCADDALLFECGVYNFTGKDLFNFNFVRQFIFQTGENEYDHMEQLMLNFYYTPNIELSNLKTSLWTYDCNNSVDEFFERVENMEHFNIPIEKYVPFDCEIWQEQV